jgi:microcystin-dependent protein
LHNILILKETLYNMNRIFILLLLCCSGILQAQNNVGIGTLTPHPSAVLDLQETGKGLLVPRTDTTTVNGMVTPAPGLLIYQTTDSTFYYHDGMLWRPMGKTTQGPPGPQGIQGVPGNAGHNGVGIVSTIDNGNGTFTFNYSDGSSFTTSNLTGPQGVQGIQGVQGPAGTNASIPSGVIFMWSGTLASIPAGFALCDGNNGTPNLLDRFIVSVPNASTNPGATGGAHTYSLTAGQMPAHSHTGSGTTSTDGNHSHSQSGYNLIGNSGPIPFYNWANSNFSTNDPNTGVAGAHSHTYSFTTSSVGSGAAIDNRPAYYSLAFIMKL